MHSTTCLSVSLLAALAACAPLDSLDEISSQISSANQSFTGTLDPGERLVVPLDAVAGDRLIMWLRKNGGQTWNPRLELHRDGRRIQYGDPRGNTDASIPWQADQVDLGFELYKNGNYELHLINRSSVLGEYEFTLECVSGPCLDTPPPPPTDPPPPPPPAPTDPWPDLSDNALETEIRSLWQSTHSRLSYKNARIALYSDIDNNAGVVEGVYTGLLVQTNGIPNGSIMNTEHTWPQSRGANSGSAKSDLNHLFGVSSSANSVRSNLHFCNVVSNVTWSKGGSRRGDDASGTRCFEPRDVHKGEVARAMFHFAVIYNKNIPASEEAVLREWNMQDPVNQQALDRNDAVEGHQGSRNTFVDYPQLAERIANF